MTAAPQMLRASQSATTATGSAELSWFARAANSVAHAAGRPAAFLLCVLIVIAWAVCGPVFHYSDTWQLVINTGTTIITFLMVFLIQNTQNRDGAALQAKLDELIRVTKEARNDLVGIENKPEEVLEEVRATGDEDVHQGVQD